MASVVAASGLVPTTTPVAEAHDGYTTTRITVNDAGDQFHGPSDMPVISPDGSLVAFRTYADNVLGPGGPECQTWLSDGTPGAFELISADNNGDPGDGCARPSAISPDGRYVVFQSYSTTLTPEGGDDWYTRIYVRDRATGTTKMAGGSVASYPSGGNSWGGAITADGRYVVFASYAPDLVAGDTNNKCDIFVSDLVTGTVTRVSNGIGGAQANEESGVPSVTPDGRYVVFKSWASNLVAGDTNNVSDVFVLDRTTSTTTRVSTSATGGEGNGDSQLWINSITNDGTLVAFQSESSNLTPGDGNFHQDVFVKNVVTGAIDLVSSDATSQSGNGWSYASTMARGGRYVAFGSHASDLVAGDTNGERDIFVRDLVTGTTKLISASTSGTPADDGSDEVSLSDDGSVAVYSSYASTLAPSDYLGLQDIFVWAPEGMYIAREPSELFGFRRSSGYISDPVNTATGNFVETHRDLDFPAVFGLDWERTYNSRDERAGPLGVGWSANFSATVTANADGSVMMRDVDGRKITFHPSGSGFTRPEEFDGTLTANPDGTHTVAYFSGSTSTFDAAGRLARRGNWDGQVVTFSWDGASLTSAASSTGYSLSLSYDQATGRLTSVSSSDGRTVSYGYGANGALSSFTDAAGGVTQYGSDANGRITQVTDPDGKPVIGNTYDSRGRVVQQTTPSGSLVTFAYADQTGVTTVTNSSTGAPTVFAHDTQGRVISVTDPNGEVLSKSYDAAGNLTSVTDRRGGITTTTYDSHGNVLARSEPGGVDSAYVYDGQNRLTSSTDGTGETTTFHYTGVKRIPYRITGPNGANTLLTSENGLVTQTSDPDGVVTLLGYDAARNLTSVTDGRGKTTAFGHDPAGNTTRIQTPMGRVSTAAFDGARRQTSSVDPTGATINVAYSPGGRVTSRSGTAVPPETYTYDAAGRLATIVDAAAKTTSLGYDADGNLTSVTRPGGSVTQHTYDPMGRLLSTKDPAGVTTTFGYDADGNRTSTTTPAGTTTQVYDARGRVTSVTDALNRTTTIEYDKADRILKKTLPDGEFMSYWYDVAMGAVQITDPRGFSVLARYSPAGRLEFRNDQVANETRYEYDPAGRLALVEAPDGEATTFAYDDDGRLVESTSPTGMKTLFAHDAAGRVTSVTDPSGATSTRVFNARGQLASTDDETADDRRFTYDARGRLIEAFDALNHKTTYTYDDRGNLVKRTNARSRSETWTHDAADRVTTWKDNSGRTTTYTYDAAGRLSTARDHAGVKVTYGYDAAGQVLSRSYASGPTVGYGYDLNGRRASMTDSTGTTSYEYDGNGNLTEVVFPGTRRVGYEYDPAGRRVGLTYPDGTEIRYSYDTANRLTSLTHPRGSVSYSYDREGRLVHEALPTGSRDYAYTLGRLTGYVETLNGIPETTGLTYDAMGRIASKTTDGMARQYAYDEAGQLVSATGGAAGGPLASTYAYDSVGHRTSQTRAGVTATFAYDASDRLTSITEPVGTTSFTYDSGSRRTQQQGPGLSIATAYDRRGLPTQQTATAGLFSTTTQRTFDGDGRMVGVQASNGAASASRSLVWDVAAPVPQVLTMRDGGVDTNLVYGIGRAMALGGAGAPAVFNRDVFGSSTSTPATASLVRSTAYDEFGTPAPEAAASSPASGSEAVSTALSLTAQLPTFGYHGELHMGAEVHLRNRQLDPATGVFTSPDPLSAPPGDITTGNRYPYAANDPVNKDDPLGLSPYGDEEYRTWEARLWMAESAIKRQMEEYQRLAELADRMRLRAKYFFMQELDYYDQIRGSVGDITFRDIADSFNDATFDLFRTPTFDMAVDKVDETLQNIQRDGVWIGLNQSLNPFYGVIAAVDRDGVLLGLGQTLNPAYGMVVNANALWHAIEDGDLEAAGQAAMGLAISAFATITFATGAVATGQAALTRLQATRTAAMACSFSAQTGVVLANGASKPISEIDVGDEVLAVDPETGQRDGRGVEHVFVHDDALVGLRIGADVVTTTEDHPFWNHTDQAFQRADELDAGDLLLTADGDLVEVGGLVAGSETRGSAYNLEVDEIHTYFVVVGGNEVLVHNACLPALADWSSHRYQFGNAIFQLDKSGFTHILQRHHPAFWDGTVKTTQTFFDEAMSISDVESAITSVARQNRDQLIEIGAGYGQVQGVVNGRTYTLGVSNGRIGQFHPLP